MPTKKIISSFGDILLVTFTQFCFRLFCIIILSDQALKSIKNQVV
jgi:hypothetical protein